MIPTSTIISMIAVVVLVILVPILVSIFFIRRYPMNLSALVLGFIMYIAFDTIFLSFFDSFVLGQTSSALQELINSTAISYTIYYAFIHALLYTGGFSVALRMTFNSDTGLGTGIAVGLGCAGASAFLSTGYPMINNITAAFSINKLGVEGFLADALPEELDSLIGAANSLLESTPTDILFGGYERLTLFAVLVSIGAIIHLAITHRSHIGYQYAAMGLLFVTYIPPALYSTGVLQSVLLLELMLTLSATASVLIAYIVGKKYGNNPVRY